MTDKRVTRDEMFAVVKSNIQEIVEGTKGIDIKESDSMRDYGADSLEIGVVQRLIGLRRLVAVLGHLDDQGVAHVLARHGVQLRLPPESAGEQHPPEPRADQPGNLAPDREVAAEGDQAE